MLSQSRSLYELPSLLSINGGPIPMSRAGLYAAAANRKIPTVRIGRRIFVPAWYIRQLLLPPEELSSE